MRKLLALLILAAVTAPTLAGGYGRYRGHRVGFRGAAYRGYGFRRFGFRSYDRGDPHAIHARVARFHQFFGHSGRPYWHHPYYLRRFGGFRPYQAYRMGYGQCGYGWGGGSNLYYPPAVAIAPIYSRLSVVLTLDDAVFDGPPADHDGLPRSREGLVGQRFLVDLH
ncbi:MAG: hypothetical protein ACYTF8_15800 [Planctomycetota bacterium]|jgi:hypothetical protein